MAATCGGKSAAVITPLRTARGPRGERDAASSGVDGAGEMPEGKGEEEAPKAAEGRGSRDAEVETLNIYGDIYGVYTPYMFKVIHTYLRLRPATQGGSEPLSAASLTGREGRRRLRPGPPSSPAGKLPLRWRESYSRSRESVGGAG